jgi:hypothetical protein
MFDVEPGENQSIRTNLFWTDVEQRDGVPSPSKHLSFWDNDKGKRGKKGSATEITSSVSEGQAELFFSPRAAHRACFSKELNVDAHRCARKKWWFSTAVASDPSI